MIVVMKPGATTQQIDHIVLRVRDAAVLCRGDGEGGLVVDESGEIEVPPGPKAALERSKRPEQAILGLRKGLGLFANLRPAICYPALADASRLGPLIDAWAYADAHADETLSAQVFHDDVVRDLVGQDQRERDGEPGSFRQREDRVDD